MKKKWFFIIGVIGTFVLMIGMMNNLVSNHDDIQSTMYFDDGSSYVLTLDDTKDLSTILLNLRYEKNKICKCLPEYKVSMDDNEYGINIREGYVRCEKGQANLTQTQIDVIKPIVTYAKSKAQVNLEYPDYSFALTWNTYGISSYDSQTGELIKTNHATNPENYKTLLKLSDEQYSTIWKLIKGLDIESYPDQYNPHSGSSEPHMTLILSVKSEGIEKTITADKITLSYECNNAKGQKFLDICKGIRDILIETDEWKSLPEYEFFYD